MPNRFPPSLALRRSFSTSALPSKIGLSLVLVGAFMIGSVGMPSPSGRQSIGHLLFLTAAGMVDGERSCLDYTPSTVMTMSFSSVESFRNAISG
jgi:hypothetical protein